MIDNNSPDENAALMELAKRTHPTAGVRCGVIQPCFGASILEQGRLLTFKRSVVVDTEANLGIQLETRIAGVISWYMRLLVLALVALMLGALSLLAKLLWKTSNRSF